MKTVFERMPEFIETDVRLRRPVDVSYRIDAEFMEKRHEAMLPESLILGKRVLDLGCAVGATGAWALSHGATYYTGVEIQKKMALSAAKNLDKYFDAKNWGIYTQTIEEFLNENYLNYDIVIVSGVIYGIVDFHSFLKTLCDITNDCIIIESMHPWKILNSKDELTPMSVWEQVIDLSIVQYAQTIRHSHEDGEKSYEYDGVRISIGAFKHIFGHLGWTVSTDANDILVITIPDVYDVKTVVNQDPNNPGDSHLVNTASGPRFVIQCFPDTKCKWDFKHSLQLENIPFKNWFSERFNN